MLIFAHRGLKSEQPENTIPAFQAAAELGFGIELDVRLREDGELVCVHDRDMEGMKHAPRLEDVVTQVITKFGEDQKAAIHVKEDEQDEQQIRILLDLFQRYHLHEKAFLFDLTFENAERIRKADLAIEIALSVGEENYAPTIYTWKQTKEHLDLFDTVWWDEWKIPGSVYTKEIAQLIHEAGKKIYAISPELHIKHDHLHAKVGYAQDWQNFIAWDVEGICTDYPREFQKHLRDKSI